MVGNVIACKVSMVYVNDSTPFQINELRNIESGYDLPLTKPIFLPGTQVDLAIYPNN